MVGAGEETERGLLNKIQYTRAPEQQNLHKSEPADRNSARKLVYTKPG